MNEQAINFYSENDFVLINEENFISWIKRVVSSELKKIGEINFIFCDDDYLLDINQRFLGHDDYTDIISFDNSLGNELSGDIFISIERVNENSEEFSDSFEEELKRVMVHGVLHFCGYKDKSAEEKETMRSKENEKIAMFHVEQ